VVLVLLLAGCGQHPEEIVVVLVVVVMVVVLVLVLMLVGMVDWVFVEEGELDEVDIGGVESCTPVVENSAVVEIEVGTAETQLHCIVVVVDVVVVVGPNTLISPQGNVSLTPLSMLCRP